MAKYNVQINGQFTVQAQTPEEAQQYAAGWIFFLVDGLKERLSEDALMFPVYRLEASSRGQETEQAGPVAGAPPKKFLKMTEPDTDR